MNISTPKIKPEYVHWSLSILTGAVIATAVVIMLGSRNVGAMQLADWQIAAIYVALIAASVRLGIKSMERVDSATSKATVNGVNK